MKEEVPSILISDGWETDANGALVEVAIPSTVETYQVPTKVTFSGETLNWIPSTTAALREFDAVNMTACSNSNFFKGYTALEKATFRKLITLVTHLSSQANGFFYGCTNLKTVNMPELLTIEACASYYGGQFWNCTSLIIVNMPKLQNIAGTTNNHSGTFGNCTSLTTINFPSLQTIGAATQGNAGAFYNCISLQNVTLGSEGHPVSSIGTGAFFNCTQSGLTITIYTTNGASLSGEPWGATNATIVYEAA